jgi:hypothetical protein
MWPCLPQVKAAPFLALFLYRVCGRGTSAAFGPAVLVKDPRSIGPGIHGVWIGSWHLDSQDLG